MTEASWNLQDGYCWLTKFDHDERDDLWNLWFRSPEDNSKCAILVTEGDDRSPWKKTNVWKMRRNENRTITVTPSIHFVGHFHSPNPVTFRLIEREVD